MRARSPRLLGGAGSGDGRKQRDGDLLTAVEALAAGGKLAEVALAVYGAETVAQRGLASDSDLRAKARRLVKKARELMKGGYLDLAAGLRPRL